MAPELRYRRDETLPFQEIQGQVIIVRPAGQEFHQLDETATFLWNRLDRPRAADDLAKELCEEYEVSPEDAARDIRSFLSDLEQKGLARRA